MCSRSAGGCVTVLVLAAFLGSGSIAAAQQIVAPGAKLELLWNDGEFTEGVAAARDGLVYFSDIGISGKKPGRIMKFDPSTGTTTVHVADSGQSNGLFFNRQGELLAVCGANHGLRALCRVAADGTMKVLVDKFEGKRFNAPNDLVVHPRGWVYFSDPRYVGPEPLELDHMSVYRYDADGKVQRVTRAIAKPNGLTLSVLADTLYVAETDDGGARAPGAAARPARFTLNAFAVKSDGSLGPKRVLADFGKDGGIDGMTSDVRGRVYAAFRQEARKGILVFSPEGKEVAHIPTPELPTNCKFGVGPAADVLYITAGTGLYRIRTNTTGYHPELP